jgi:hypothetical protein
MIFTRSIITMTFALAAVHWRGAKGLDKLAALARRDNCFRSCAIGAEQAAPP